MKIKVEERRNICTNIKNLRLMKKISIKELSEKTKVSKKALYCLEKGEYCPSFNTGIVIAKALDTDIITLMGSMKENPMPLASQNLFSNLGFKHQNLVLRMIEELSKI